MSLAGDVDPRVSVTERPSAPSAPSAGGWGVGARAACHGWHVEQGQHDAGGEEQSNSRGSVDPVFYIYRYDTGMDPISD